MFWITAEPSHVPAAAPGEASAAQGTATAPSAASRNPLEDLLEPTPGGASCSITSSQGLTCVLDHYRAFTHACCCPWGSQRCPGHSHSTISSIAQPTGRSVGAHSRRSKLLNHLIARSDLCFGSLQSLHTCLLLPLGKPALPRAQPQQHQQHLVIHWKICWSPLPALHHPSLPSQVRS